MPFQPHSTTTALSTTDLEPSGLVYSATADSSTGHYAIGDKVEVQTVTTASGTSVQYFNLMTGTVISATTMTKAVIESDFVLVGSSAQTPTTLMKLGSFEGRTVVDAVTGEEKPFTLAEWAASIGKTVPNGSGYVKMEMQRRDGTSQDCFLYTEGAEMPTLSPQIGQLEQDKELFNQIQIADAKFLGKPSQAGNQIVLIATFWNKDPKN